MDSLGNVGTRLYNVNIGTVTLTVNPATLPAAVVGRPYSQTVVGSGGTAPYTFSITAGALPPGLTLNGVTGVISGTPTSGGAVSFTVQALDVNGNIGSRAYSLNNRADPALDPEVQGLISAQVASAQRFASAQVNNVARHLEGLHDHFNPCSFNFGVAPPIDPAQQQPGAHMAIMPIRTRSIRPPEITALRRATGCRLRRARPARRYAQPTGRRRWRSGHRAHSSSAR